MKKQKLRMDRFRNNVDRFGKPKPALEQLINEFTMNFLEFSEFRHIGIIYQHPFTTTAFLEHYNRPLKPLEYYFSDSQLQQILRHRLAHELSSELPTKIQTLQYVQSEKFLKKLEEKYSDGSASERREAFLNFLTTYTDEKLRMRPISTLEEILKSHPLANAPVNGPLGDEIVRMQKEGKLKPGDATALAMAMKNSGMVPLPTPAEELENEMLEELEKLSLATTPQPDANVSLLPYYERLRMEGKLPSTPKRRRSSRTSPSNSVAVINDRPNVYPFTARSGYIGNGMFVNPVTFESVQIDSKKAIEKEHEIKPLIRQWKPHERLLLKQFIDYTNEWLAANGMLDGTLDKKNSSGIDWMEKKLSDMTQDEILRVIQHTPASSEGPILDSKQDALRIITQQTLSDTQISDLIESGSSPIIISESSHFPSKDILFDQARDILKQNIDTSTHSLLNNTTTTTTTTTTYSTENSKNLGWALTKHLRKRFSFKPPIYVSQFDVVKPGYPRTNNYSVEVNPKDETSFLDSSTFKVRTPIRRLDADSELNVYHKLCWLLLVAVSKMDTEALMKNFMQGNTGQLNLEDIWEVKRLATKLAQETHSLYSDIQVTSEQLESVAKKVKIDFSHIHNFIADNLEFIGVNLPHKDQTATNTQQITSIGSPSNTEDASSSIESISNKTFDPMNGVLEDGKLTEQRRKTILEGLMEKRLTREKLLEKYSPMAQVLKSTLKTYDVTEFSEHGDHTVINKPVHRRLEKMPTEVQELVATLTGSELRSLFPLDLLYCHPFLTLSQRSSSLAPVLAVDSSIDPKLRMQVEQQLSIQKEHVSSSSSSFHSNDTNVPSSYDVSPATISAGRQYYLDRTFPNQILKHLQTLQLQEGVDGTLTPLGTAVERINRILDLAPVGMAISDVELAKAFETASQNASTSSEQSAISSTSSLLQSVSVKNLFNMDTMSPRTQGDWMLRDPKTSEKFEKIINEGGLASTSLQRDSVAYRELEAELSVYKQAKTAQMKFEEEKRRNEEANSRVPELVEKIRARLQPLLGLVRPESRFMIEPMDSDTFDMLLLKQDILARLEEHYMTFDSIANAKARLPKEVTDADIIITKLDGTVIRERYKRDEELNEDGEENDEEIEIRTPKSILFGDSEMTSSLEGVMMANSNANQSFGSSHVSDQHLLESELNAIRDMLGVSAKSLDKTNLEEIKELMKTFIRELTGMDILLMWEKYPDLAPPAPLQSIHGPFREVFDPITPNRKHMPHDVRHMYEPMKEALTTWYMNRDEDSYAPILQQPWTDDDMMPVDQAINMQMDMKNWIQAYTVDLAFPTEKVALFHEVVRFSPRLFRKMDMDRDLATLRSYEDTIDILKANETMEERIEWYKSYQLQIFKMVNAIKAVIGPDGESYLKYNEEIILKWLQENKMDQSGNVSVEDIGKLAEAVLRSGELDNPNDRVTLQIIRTFLKLSLDATEMDRLSGVKTELDFELWTVWKILRKIRHSQKATETPFDENSWYKNKQLPHGHPDKRYDEDHLDEEEDKEIRSKLNEALIKQTLENAPPAIPTTLMMDESTGKDVQENSTEYFVGMAKKVLPQLKQKLEDEKNEKFWAEQDQIRSLKTRHSHGMSLDPEVRKRDIAFSILDLLPKSILPEDALDTWFETFAKDMESKLPEHIRNDQIYARLKETSKEKQKIKEERKKKKIDVPLPEHLIDIQSEAISTSSNQAKRIATFLRTFPQSQHIDILKLKVLADLYHGQTQEWLATPFKPEFRVNDPSNLTLKQAQTILNTIGIDLSFFSNESILEYGQQTIARFPRILQDVTEHPHDPARYAVQSYFVKLNAKLKDDDVEEEDDTVTLIQSIDPKEIFPSAFWGVPNVPSPSLYDSSAPLPSSSNIEQHTKRKTIEPTLIADQLLYNSLDIPKRFEAVLASLKTSPSSSSPISTNTPPSEQKKLQKSEKEAWNAVYQLFMRTELVSSILTSYAATSSTNPWAFTELPLPPRLTSEFESQLKELQKIPPPTFPLDISPLKMIPWTTIQRLMGYTDRQLKTLMLFLADKSRYTSNLTSRPQNMPGFRWDLSEFNAIRNRFMGIRLHPSGNPSREEMLTDLLFGIERDSSPHLDGRSALAPASAEAKAHATIATESSHAMVDSTLSETGKYNFYLQPFGESFSYSSHPAPSHSWIDQPRMLVKPVDSRIVLRGTVKDRLEWAREEARLYPLDETTKLSFGQLNLVNLGFDASLFEDTSLSGMQKLMPVHLHAKLGDKELSNEEFLIRLEKLASVTTTNPNKHVVSMMEGGDDSTFSSSIQDQNSHPPPPVPIDEVIKVECITYEPGQRIELDEPVGMGLAVVSDATSMAVTLDSAKTLATDSTETTTTTTEIEGETPSSSTSEMPPNKSNAEEKKPKGDDDDEEDDEAEVETPKPKSDPSEAAFDLAAETRAASEDARLEAQAFVEWEAKVSGRYSDGDGDDYEAAGLDSDGLETFDLFNSETLDLIEEYATNMHHSDIPPELDYPIDKVNAEYLIGQRRQLNFLIMSKWARLKRSAKLLDLEEAFPANIAYLNALRSIWLNQLELTYWHAIPYRNEHRKLISEMAEQNLVLSAKMHRRLMVQMGPLIWGTSHYVPQDSFGELFLGMTPYEMHHSNFSSNRAIMTPAGPIIPKKDLRGYPDPEESEIWAKKRLEYQREMNSRRLLNRKRTGILVVILALAAFYGFGNAVYNHLQQDEDSLDDRIRVETQILKTNVVAAFDRAGFAFQLAGKMILNIGKGIAWLFTYSIDKIEPIAGLLQKQVDEALAAVPEGGIVPTHLMSAETSGYHYREHMKTKLDAEVKRDMSIIAEAYDIYENRAHSPELQAKLKEKKDKIDDAIRLAQLRQYEKQKRDYAMAEHLPSVISRPEMPEWFPLPENRYWDQIPALRYHAPHAEKFWKRAKWAYHVDDNAPKVPLRPADEHLFHSSAKVSTEGIVIDPGIHTWLPRGVDDLGRDD
jgi:hypothetical protein